MIWNSIHPLCGVTLMDSSETSNRSRPLPFLAGGHRYAPEWKTRDEVRRTVQGIDDPDPLLVSTAAPAPLLAQKAVAGKALANPRRDDLFALFVGPRHEIVLLFLGDRAARETPPVTFEDLAPRTRSVGRGVED